MRYPNDEIKSYDHYGFEDASLFIEGIKNVGPDRDKLIAYFRTVKFSGLLGTTQFDEKGDTLNKTITIYRVENGVFKPTQKK
jgi:branched-chain amino acid transport system substrate-binding protein